VTVNTITSVYDARRENLRARLEERGAKTALAVKLGVTQPFVSHLLRDPTEATARVIHEDLAKQIEEITGLQPGELDLPFVRGSPDWGLLATAVRLTVEIASAANQRLSADLAVRAIRAAYETSPRLGGIESESTRALVAAILRS
jgi:hypothetical protein